jgi:hypothetical protein
LNEIDARKIMEKNKDDPIFRGTLNQLEIFRQIKHHLINEVVRYHSIGRTDIANFIRYSMSAITEDE